MKIKVLLADAQAILADGIKSVISSSEELEVVGVASNGLEAVALAGEKRPDVILMDIRMPGMNGYEATRAIRALPRPDAGTVPIIAMSADAFSEDVQRCLACGMNGHTAKPIDVDEVAKKLKSWFAPGKPS